MTTRQLLVRPLLLWLLVSGGLLSLLQVVRPELGRLPALGSLAWTPALVTVCASILAACAAWFWLTLTVALASTVFGRRTCWIGAPPWLRRTIVGLCGALAVGIPAATHATPVAGAPPGTPDTPSLEGMSVPTLPDTRRPPVERQPAAQAGRTESVVVRPGDSLWSIAESHQPADATNTEIDHAWRRLWQDNRAVIGDDPHLVRPGQQLQIDVEDS